MSQEQELIKDGLILRPALFRSQANNSAEGNREARASLVEEIQYMQKMAAQANLQLTQDVDSRVCDIVVDDLANDIEDLELVHSGML